MPTLPSERNLLFAVLALQNELAEPDDVLSAMQAWVAAKHRPLGELLVERGALDSEHRRLLDALIEAHVANRICICPTGESLGCQQGRECLPLSNDAATGAAPGAAAMASAVPWPTLAQLESDHIQRTLLRTGYNQRAAADLLGLHRQQLLRRIKKYGLDASSIRPGRPNKLPKP
ncbi:MAG: helix-turn-helix domain-containing protein [Thermoguttaceae bacterium]